MTNAGYRYLYLGRAALLTCCLALAGCGPNELEGPTAIKLKGLATCSLDYGVSKGKTPPDEAALRKHMDRMEDFILDMNGIDPKNIDAAFKGERDNEPFVICYNVPVSIGGSDTPLVAYEKTGKDGQRLGVLMDGQVLLMDEAKLKELTSSPR